MKSFREIAESYDLEITEKKMKASDKKKAALALKKRKKTPEYKSDKKKQDACNKKLKPDVKNKACGMGEITPHKIDKKRSKSSKIGSRSR